MKITNFSLNKRLWETYGEDVHLASKMAEAYISGHQGQDLKARTKAAVCLKHYMGYSFPFNGKDRTNAYIPDVLLREKFLPTFAQGVATVIHDICYYRN